MQDTKLFELILGLEEPWYISDLNLNLESEQITIHVEYRENYKNFKCPICNKGCSIYDHRETRTWRHLNICQYETYLVCSVPRVSCTEHKVKTVSVPWGRADSGFTLLFEKFAIDLLKACKVQKKVAQILNIHPSRLHRIMEQAVARGYAKRDASVVTEYLGIDEKSMKKGHHYMSILTDITRKYVIDLVEGKKKEDTEKLIDILNDKQKKAVKAVAMDMSQSFISAMNDKLPDAKKVFDLFHIIQYLSKAVDNTRKKENKKLAGNNDNSLKRTKYLFLKNTDNLNEKQLKQRDALLQLPLDTAIAWAAKENFKEIYKLGSFEKAKIFFNHWIESTKNLNNTFLEKVTATFKSHEEGILNYFLHPITNALTESLNSQIQLIKASARGFRAFKNYRTAILFFLGNLDLYPQ